MDCPVCNSPRVRNSRTRPADLPRLLILRSPVRCHNCQERFYVPVWQATEVRRASKIRHAEERSSKTVGR